MTGRLRSLLASDRGASAYVEFLIVVVPFIVILFVMFEISNISHTRMSMARGVQEALIKTSMSPLAMSDPARWQDFGAYVLSQGNSSVQFDASKVRFVSSQGEFDGVHSLDPGEVVIFVEADSAAPAGTNVTSGSVLSGGSALFIRSRGKPAATSLAYENPPTITAQAKYGYSYLTNFIGYFFWSAKSTPPTILMQSGLTSVNEHPDYEKVN